MGRIQEPTDEMGVYRFDGLFSGNYLLAPTNPGYIFTPPQRSASVPPSVSGQDFSAVLPSIAGLVKTINSQPYGGVTILLSNGLSLTSGDDGRYEVKGVAPGNYTLTPVGSGNRFSPSFAVVTIPPYHGQQDFTILPMPVVQTVAPDQPAVITFADIQGTITTLSIPAGAVDVPTEIHLIPTEVVRQEGLSRDTPSAWLLTRGEPP